MVELKDIKTITMVKKITKEAEETEVGHQTVVVERTLVNESSKEEMLWLYGELQRLGIRSIGDIENKIARL